MWGSLMSSRPNSVDSLTAGDQVVIFRGNSTDYRVVPFDVLKDEILKDVPTPTTAQTPIVQHYNPNGDFTLIVENHAAGTYLVLNPSIGITTGAITLPSHDLVVDQQEILFSCTQQITNFSVNSGGAIVIGAPNAISATAFFKLKYDKLSDTWYRVG